MSTQIAVRLDDRLVRELDAVVAAGGAGSRASVIESALERELRRRLYLRDVEILMSARASGRPDELADLHDWVARHRPPVD